MEPSARQAWRGDRELELTRRPSTSCWRCWSATPASSAPTSMIYDRVWGYDFGPDSKTLAVYISYLRRKLEEGGETRILQTVRGVGYTVRAP